MTTKIALSIAVKLHDMSSAGGLNVGAAMLDSCLVGAAAPGL
jgi:hypothetical protein